MNRNCNDELVVKIIGKLTMEFRELEVDLPINIIFKFTISIHGIIR